MISTPNLRTWRLTIRSFYTTYGHPHYYTTLHHFHSRGCLPFIFSMRSKADCWITLLVLVKVVYWAPELLLLDRACGRLCGFGRNSLCSSCQCVKVHYNMVNTAQQTNNINTGNKALPTWFQQFRQLMFFAKNQIEARPSNICLPTNNNGIFRRNHHSERSSSHNLVLFCGFQTLVGKKM